MKKIIHTTALYSLFVCLYLFASCDSSSNKSNIESTSTKTTDNSTTTAIPDSTTQQTAQKPDTTATPTSADASLAAGEKIFTTQCTMCHKLNKETLIGPGLAGVNERRPQVWLISWIKNSQKMIESGDKYGKELFNKFNKVAMPSYDYSDEEIKSILAYIDKNEQP